MQSQTTFRLWHRCLQRTPIKDWKTQVQKDLGGVHELDFRDWWPQVKEHFREEKPFVCKWIKNPAAAKQFGLWDRKIRRLGMHEIVLLVSLDFPRDTVMAEIEKQLKSIKKVTRGVPKKIDLASYPLYRAPRIDMIRKLLRVYDAYNSKDAEARPSLWELAIKLELSPTYLPKETADASAADRALIQDKKRTLAVIAFRYVKQAEALVSNAAQGVFPKY